MKTVLRFSLLGALLLGGHAFAAEPKKFDISMFPAAEVNQERVVIRLPEVENEADMMVELQVGKKISALSSSGHLRLGPDLFGPQLHLSRLFALGSRAQARP